MILHGVSTRAGSFQNSTLAGADLMGLGFVLSCCFVCAQAVQGP